MEQFRRIHGSLIWNELGNVYLYIWYSLKPSVPIQRSYGQHPET